MSPVLMLVRQVVMSPVLCCASEASCDVSCAVLVRLVLMSPVLC